MKRIIIITLTLLGAVSAWALTEVPLPTAVGSTLSGGNIYKVTSDVTISATTAGQNALVVAANSTVTIYIAKNCTLTVSGGPASGTTGGGAGICVPGTSTLIITGEGTLNATGGNGTYGSQGGGGGSADTDRLDSRPGQGGAGGNGGGGAGAGIGGNGGNGGNGGAQVGTKGGNVHWSVKMNGANGNNGGNGTDGAVMGNVYVVSTVVVTATGGTASTYQYNASSGGGNYTNASDGGGVYYGDAARPYGDYRWSAGGGGAGGNGGNGSQAVAIGGGGYGAAGAGSGGQGGKDYTFNDASYNNWWYARSCHGADGKGGQGSTNGRDGSGSSWDKGSVYAVYGSGSNSYWTYRGGAAGQSGTKGSVGGNGNLYAMSSASLTQKTASRDVSVISTPPSDIQVSLTLKSLGDSVGVQQAYYGVPLGSVKALVRAGYTFHGYYDAPEGGTQVFNADGVSNNLSLYTESDTLHARWEYKISTQIDPDGGTKLGLTGHVSTADVIYALDNLPEDARTIANVDISKASDVIDSPSDIIDNIRNNSKSNPNTLVYLPLLKKGQSIPSDKAQNIVKMQVGGTDTTYACADFSVTDGTPVSVAHPFSADAATYSRKGSSRWGTVCVPYALKSDSRIQFYTSGSIVGSELILEKADTVPAGQGAIYQAKYIDISGEGGSTSVKKDFAKTDVVRAVVTAPASSAAYVKIQGQFTELVIDDAKAGDFSGYDLYYYKDNKFYKRTEGQTVTIPALRAYVLVPQSIAPTSMSIMNR